MDDEGDEHFVPPPPPPLPHLDPVAKGAWTALFGGPAYLLFTTLMGWEVPGWAALLAVMAFVGGFATVVLRLSDGPSRGSGPGQRGGALSRFGFRAAAARPALSRAVPELRRGGPGQRRRSGPASAPSWASLISARGR